MRLERTLIALALLGFAATGWTQGWSPQRNVEIVVGFVPGGGIDRTARTLDRLLTANQLVNSSISVVNKPGGNSGIAYAYVSQRPADGHTLMVGGLSLHTNHITGSSPLTYNDFTLIASLFEEYSVFSVNPTSPIRTGKDLIARLNADPRSVTTGYAAVGGGNHLAAVMLHKAIGIKVTNIKGVSFKGAAEVIVNLLGGHIDVAATSTGAVLPHVAAGRLHIVAVAAPKRIGGPLAGVPTWKEQGMDVVSALPRVIIGPRGMGPAQVAFWENALRKATETAEWKADIEQNLWLDSFAIRDQFRANWVQEYATTKSLLGDLGLARQ
jgi:putative tricarboxylic transport membrane protein